MNFFRWHKRQTECWLEKFGMSDYVALWFAYIKGVVTTLIVLRLMGYL